MLPSISLQPHAPLRSMRGLGILQRATANVSIGPTDRASPVRVLQVLYSHFTDPEGGAGGEVAAWNPASDAVSVAGGIRGVSEARHAKLLMVIIVAELRIGVTLASVNADAAHVLTEPLQFAQRLEPERAHA